MDYMIHFEEVTKIFKADILGRSFKALDNVSFDVPSGSMVGFLGANGAGKTTSLKIIMDFIRPSTGQVRFSDELGRDRREIYRNIGFLPERPYFYQHLTGHEFLTYMGQLSDLSSSEIQTQVTRWAPRFKIDHALQRALKSYSKGMLQRIGFLATILHSPKIIILDEPLSGLDPIGRKELKDVIVDVHREGKTVFFSSHIVPDIEEICDRVVFLKEGKLVYDGSVSSLLKQGGEPDYVLTFRRQTPFQPQTPHAGLLALPDGLTKFSVSAPQREHAVRELMDAGCELIGLEAVKPSLEEIFYHTGGRP
jgi:ABC-2 type transport system ATP-binding protein